MTRIILGSLRTGRPEVQPQLQEGNVLSPQHIHLRCAGDTGASGQQNPPGLTFCGCPLELPQWWWPLDSKRLHVPSAVGDLMGSHCSGRATPIPGTAMGLHSICGDSSPEGREVNERNCLWVPWNITESFPLWGQFPTQGLGRTEQPKLWGPWTLSEKMKYL